MVSMKRSLTKADVINLNDITQNIYGSMNADNCKYTSYGAQSS